MNLRRAMPVPHLAYLAACALTVLAIAVLGWWTAWRAFGVPTLEPVFADLRTIQAGLGAAHPQVSNPGDPWGRPMNYPSIWLDIARVLHWEREGNYRAFAAGIDLAFVACCFDLIRRYRSWWIAALALSGACALGLERANNDMAIFVLLYVSAVTARPLFTVLVPLAALLKLYPVLVLPAFIRRPRLAVMAAAGCAAAIAVLVPELPAIRAGTPAGAAMSYGAPLYAVALQEAGVALPVAAMMAALLAGAALLHAAAPGLFRKPPCDARTTALFLCGAGIFLGTTLLGPNWDYRLSFLLMTLPLIAALEAKGLRIGLPMLMLFACSQPLLDGFAGETGWRLNLAAKAALFVLLGPLAIRALLDSLPGRDKT